MACCAVHTLLPVDTDMLAMIELNLSLLENCQ